jgi:hypothetical protein
MKRTMTDSRVKFEVGLVPELVPALLDRVEMPKPISVLSPIPQLGKTSNELVSHFPSSDLEKWTPGTWTRGVAFSC